MTAGVMRVAAELRGRWWASLVLAALVGLVGGVAIATLAGAWRTSTSFDRMIEAVEGWDVLVNPDLGTETALDLDAVGDLPEVAALSRAAGMPVFALDDEGNPDWMHRSSPWRRWTARPSSIITARWYATGACGSIPRRRGPDWSGARQRSRSGRR